VAIHSEEAITRGLVALVLYGGRFKPAARFLKASGTPIPESTLRNWKDRYPDRYHRLQHEKMKEIEEQQISGLLELFQESQEAIRLGVELEIKRLRASGVRDAQKQPVKDAAASVDKMSKALKLVGEHALSLQGRPTQTVELPGRRRYFAGP